MRWQQRREEYLSFVAHDLRTPLSAISLSARVLELLFPKDRTETRQATQMLNTLHRNVHHLEALVKKVIEESTNLGTEVGVKLERWEFDLWPLVESLIVDLHTVAGTGSTRLTNAVPEDFVVYADASLVRRVLQNPIANAITHTPSGEVIIGAKNTEPAGDVECFVQDSGRGIPPERCQSVFEKYETDRENEGGLGVGSTFRFTLPGKKA